MTQARCCYAISLWRYSCQGCKPTACKYLARLPRWTFAMHRALQQSQEIAAAHGSCSHAGQVRGLLLTIYMCDATNRQKVHQVGQCQLAGVRHPREHGFSEEEAAHAYAIQPAGQFAINPGFYAVCDTGTVPGCIGCLYGRRNPCAVLCLASARATRNDRSECDVRRHPYPGIDVLFGSRYLPTFLGQRMRDLQVCTGQYHARIGAPPQYRIAVVEPWEDTARIGFGQPLYGQATARSNQTFRQRGCGVRKRGRVVKPDQTTHGCSCLARRRIRDIVMMHGKHAGGAVGDIVLQLGAYRAEGQLWPRDVLDARSEEH